MAESKKLTPFILRWEGGYVNDPDDSGGETNRGITVAAWRQAGFDCTEKIPSLTVNDSRGRPVTYTGVTRSLYEMTGDEWHTVFKKFYWDRWRADEIRSQSVADILVDWVWASGAWGIRIPQRLLGVAQDGFVGPKTIAAVNAAPPEELFRKIREARLGYIDDICRSRPSNEKFRKGWLNRIDCLRFAE